MNTIGTWTGRAGSVTALSTAALLGFAGLAHADTMQDTIADDGTGVVLVAGSGQSGTAAIKVVGNNAQGDADPGCNIDAGESPLKLDIMTPAGLRVEPDVYCKYAVLRPSTSAWGRTGSLGSVGRPRSRQRRIPAQDVRRRCPRPRTS